MVASGRHHPHIELEAPYEQIAEGQANFTAAASRVRLCCISNRCNPGHGEGEADDLADRQAPNRSPIRAGSGAVTALWDKPNMANFETPGRTR
jgi:hypothetical protein